MPRNSGGVYSLPAGNPVVTNTTISSTWANTTLSDIATALTGSLARDGSGAMTDALKLADGTVGAPSLTFGSQTTMGIYRFGSNVLAISTASTLRWTVNATGNHVFEASQTGNGHTMVVYGSTGVGDGGLHIKSGSNSGNYCFVAQPASAASNYLVIFGDGGMIAGNPTGGNKGASTLNTAGEIYVSGDPVRGMPFRNFSGSDNTVVTDIGRALVYAGAGGHTFTFDTDLPVSSLCTVINAGTGNLTIAGSGSLSWYNGSGAASTGSRTLAVGGVCTVWQGVSGAFNIWGTGLS